MLVERNVGGEQPTLKFETAKTDAVSNSAGAGGNKPRAHSLPTTEIGVEEKSELSEEKINCDVDEYVKTEDNSKEITVSILIRPPLSRRR